MNAHDSVFLSAAGDDAILPGLSAANAADLAPQVIEIDQHGLYPDSFMRTLGGIGGFASIVPARSRS